MRKKPQYHWGKNVSLMAFASLTTLGTTSDVTEEVRSELKANLGDLTSKFQPKPVVRPKRGSTPPKWAIAGPGSDLITYSNRPECVRNIKNYGLYEAPQKLGDYQILYPRDNPVQDSEYDLWVHFHGSKLFQGEWVREMRKTILATLHLRGLSGVYLERLKRPYDWRQIQETVTQAVNAHYGVTASPRRIGLSGWSAGCAATERISDFDMQNIDGIICLDGFHGTYRGPDNEAIHDFSRFRFATSLPVNLPDYSLLSALGARFLGISHSSVPCSGTCRAGDTSYASTTATARNMIWAVGGTEEDVAYEPVKTEDPYVVYNTYDQGHFHVVGRKGGDGPAHCRVFDDVAPLLEKAKTEAGFE